MDIDRKQRTDIDDVANDRITLAIDEFNIEESPYEHTLIKGFIGNNWVKEGDDYVKYNLVEDDNLTLSYDPITKLSHKNITKIIVSFDYALSNHNGSPYLSNVSFIGDDTNYKSVDYKLNDSGHIDVDCQIFGMDNEVLNTVISSQGFGIGLNFNGKYSNSTVRISNIKFKIEFTNKLVAETDSVINRLEPMVDFYIGEDENLILQIGGDATGKGMDRGSGVDTYSKTEIDNKLAAKVDTITGKGLSSNDYTNAEKAKLSGVAENANYYIHPSTHNTGIVIESSALTNLDTSSNATQHEINLAIDNVIGDKQDLLISGENIKTINNNSILGSGNISIQGGGGSVIGTGSFRINAQGHLIVELPDGVDNPYYINSNGHLIYDTSNTHNNGV